MRFILVFILLITGFATYGDNIFKVRIENDNLIVCLQKQIPADLEYLELRLRGGKKIKIIPVESGNCKSMFYLNSRQAKQVKKRGVKSVVFHGSISNFKIRVNENQNKQFISNLP